MEFLDERGEISLRSTVDGNFRKSLLLCVASYFEKVLSDHIADFIEEVSSQNMIALEFVRNKAIRYQYHTWFAWKERNANQFFSLFGDEFKRFMRDRIKSTKLLIYRSKRFLKSETKKPISASGFGSFSLEKTTAEIYELYRKGGLGQVECCLRPERILCAGKNVDTLSAACHFRAAPITRLSRNQRRPACECGAPVAAGGGCRIPDSRATNGG